MSEDSSSVAEALYFSACAEQGSEHPIAKGVSNFWDMGVSPYRSFEYSHRRRLLSFFNSNSRKGSRIWIREGA
jgi:hypothetical protein